MWGSKGYAKEVPPVAMAIPPTVIASPQHVEPVAVDAEREREREREEEISDMGGREEDTSSHSLTAVSVFTENLSKLLLHMHVRTCTCVHTCICH